MPYEVRIPSLGESVTEGVIVRWAKQEGELVGPDDVLLELETDKASTELPAGYAGVLRILKQQGETVAVGDVVALLDDHLAHLSTLITHRFHSPLQAVLTTVPIGSPTSARWMLPGAVTSNSHTLGCIAPMLHSPFAFVVVS